MGVIKFIFSFLILLAASVILYAIWSIAGIGLFWRIVVTAMMLFIIIRILIWWWGYIKGRYIGWK